SPGGDHGYYAFDSGGGAGTVRVLVLDTSAGSLGNTQRCWLGSQLASAASHKPSPVPAIVIGNQAATALSDSSAVIAARVTGNSPGCPATKNAGASAYFYSLFGQNRESTLTSGSEAIPAFGTGSLGYLDPGGNIGRIFRPESGFLVAEVDTSSLDSANRGD